MRHNLQTKGYHVENIGTVDPDEIVTYLESEFNIKNHSSTNVAVNDKMVKISNFDGLFSNVVMDWHYDGLLYTDQEHMVSLYCKSSEDSSTSIWSGAEAIKALTPEHRQFILDSNDITLNTKIDPPIHVVSEADAKVRTLRNKDRVLNLNRMFIETHPVFGDEYLHFPFKFLNNSEVIEMILEYYFEPFIHVHHWNEGDIVIMDQFSTMHRREAFHGDRMLYHCVGHYKK